MSKRLDILVIESQPWVGEGAARTLTDAGHRVHRCHEPGDTGCACAGLHPNGECPLDGHVGAAVLVRADAGAPPTPHEDGVRCAIRSGVPLVEVSGTRTGPFADWVALSTEERSVAAACVTAVELAKQPLREAMATRAEPLLVEHGIDPEDTSWSIESRWPELRVHLDVGGLVDSGLEHALSVRSLDALRPFTTTFSSVVVSVSGHATN